MDMKFLQRRRHIERMHGGGDRSSLIINNLYACILWTKGGVDDKPLHGDNEAGIKSV